jgi:Gpi18-like mannosyltransferase
MLQKPSGLNKRVWVACGLVVLVAKLAFALNTIGTNDVVTWHRFADTIADHNPLWLYHADPLFNHPPFMTRVLPVLRWLSSHTPFGFPLWIRLPAILADFGSLWRVALILQPNTRLLVLLAICPVSILVSGFHGNTDAVMVFFILLAIYLLDKRKWLLAGAVAFGMAACIKVAAIALVPAFLFYLSPARRFRPRLWRYVHPALLPLPDSGSRCNRP